MDQATFLTRALRNLDEHLTKRAKRMARRKKMPVASLLRMALGEWLEEQEAEEAMSKAWQEITRSKKGGSQ